MLLFFDVGESVLSRWFGRRRGCEREEERRKESRREMGGERRISFGRPSKTERDEMKERRPTVHVLDEILESLSVSEKVSESVQRSC